MAKSNSRVITVSLATLLLASGCGQAPVDGPAPPPSAPAANVEPSPTRGADHTAAGKGIVYALVIGITEYGRNEASASKATAGAKSFADVVAKTYGTQAVHLLLDQDATVANVRKSLLEIRRVPEGSLVIIYFSGHGHREFFPGSDNYPSELYLRLHGSTATDFLGDSIEVKELWHCLLPTKLTNGLIFLDCCYSGQEPQPFSIPQLELNLANIRAFMLASSSSNEVTTGGVFTEALLDVWRQPPPTGKCLTLDELADLVSARVDERDQKFMTAKVCFSTGIARCLTHMTEPSALLTCTFPRGCKNPMDINFNGVLVQRGFEYTPQNRVFVSQVSRNHPVTVKIVVRGGADEQLLPEFVVDPRQFASPVIELPISVPNQYATVADLVPPNESAEAYLQVAKVTETFGLNPARLYWETAQLQHKADPATDKSWALAKASHYEPTNQIYAVAAAGGAVTDAMIGTLSPELSQSIVNGRQALDALENVGAYTAAAMLSGQLAKAEPLSDHRAELELRSIGDDKIGGLGADEVERRLAAVDLEDSSEVLKALSQGIQTKSTAELRNEWATTPKSLDDYASLAQWLKPGVGEGILRGIGVGEDSEAALRFALYRQRPGFSYMHDGDTLCVGWGGHPVLTHGCSYGVKSVPDGRYQIMALDAATWRAYQSIKPGYSTFVDRDSVWVEPADSGTASDVQPVMAQFMKWNTAPEAYDSVFDGAGPAGLTIRAPNEKIAKGYYFAQPGFLVDTSGDVVVIKRVFAADDEETQTDPETTVIPTPFGETKITGLGKGTLGEYLDHKKEWELY